MLRLSNLSGLPVLETCQGTQMGIVTEVLLCPDMAALAALHLDNNCFVSFSHIFRIGEDAITILAKSAVHDMRRDFFNNCPKMGDLLEKPIFTENGFEIGILTDIFFEGVTGELRGYELSDSLLTDFVCGRKIMPLPKAQVVAKDKIIVPEAMAELTIHENSISV